MSDLKLRLAQKDYRTLPLTPEEGFVLSRIPGSVRAADLASLTGLDPKRVAEIARHLVEIGALLLEEGASPAAGARAGVAGKRVSVQPVPAAVAGTARSHAKEGGAPPISPPVRVAAPLAAPPARLVAAYSERFKPLKPAERANRAQHAEGEDLECLCLDAHPQVVLALLANPHLSATHGVLLAAYHPNASGLELLARSHLALQQPDVALSLLSNPRLPPGARRHLLATASLEVIHALSLDRALPPATLNELRASLVERFAGAAPEERVALLLATEGRVLASLSGWVFDGRTTALLCREITASATLVECLARFQPTPPSLIEALLGQSIVREHPQLEALLLDHPNMQGRVYPVI